MKPESFDAWWRDTYARHPNYDVMKHLGRAAWDACDKAATAERERLERLLGRLILSAVGRIHTGRTPEEMLDAITTDLAEFAKHLHNGPVTFCSWCPDPANPDPGHHPDGQYRHGT